MHPARVVKTGENKKQETLYTTLYASVTLHTLVVYTVYTEEWHNLASVCCKKETPTMAAESIRREKRN
jgi:hypothetical protein